MSMLPLLLLAASPFLVLGALTAHPDGTVEHAADARGCIRDLCPAAGERVEASATVPLLLAINHKDPAGLKRLFYDVNEMHSPNNGRFVGKEELVARFSDADGAAAVVAWLERGGVRATVSSSGFFVRAVGPVHAVEVLLNATYRAYRAGDNKASAVLLRSARHTVPAQLPIAAIYHVSDFATSTVHPSKLTEGTGTFSNVVPSTLYAQYGIDFSALPNGWQTATATINGQSYTNSMGLFEIPSSPASTANLASFGAKFGIDNIGTFESVGPGFNDQSKCSGASSVSTCGVEASLDVQYLAAIAAGMSSSVYYAASGRTGWAPWADWVLGQSNPALVQSISYSVGEDAETAASLANGNSLFQQMGARGISVFFASGDGGVSNYRGKGSVTGNCGFNPGWPSSSPFVTSVGGTQVDDPVPCTEQFAFECPVLSGTPNFVEVASSSGNPWGEEVTSGGGFSCGNSAEPYQQGAGVYKPSVLPYLADDSNIGGGSGSKGTSQTCPATSYPPTADTFNKNGRGFPDISALAWQYEIISGTLSSGGPYTVAGVAGTSAATPVVAGMFAIINGVRLQLGMAPVGFVNTKLYTHAAGAAGIFTDVLPRSGDANNNMNVCTSGDGCCPTEAYGFKTAVGWDAFTGLGTPKFQPLLSFLTSPTPAPPPTPPPPPPTPRPVVTFTNALEFWLTNSTCSGLPTLTDSFHMTSPGACITGSFGELSVKYSGTTCTSGGIAQLWQNSDCSGTPASTETDAPGTGTEGVCTLAGASSTFASSMRICTPAPTPAPPTPQPVVTFTLTHDLWSTSLSCTGTPSLADSFPFTYPDACIPGSLGSLSAKFSGTTCTSGGDLQLWYNTDCSGVPTSTTTHAPGPTKDVCILADASSSFASGMTVCTPAPTPAPNSHAIGGGGVAGVVLGALALVGAGVFVLLRRRSSRENESIASATSDVATQGMELGAHTVVANPVNGGHVQSATSATSGGTAAGITTAAAAATTTSANPAYGDDGVRERSTTDQSLEARQDPESLIGQRIDVVGKGTGTVTGVKKAKGRSTQHLVAFGDGAAPELVLLQKRGGKEGRGFKFHIIGGE